MTRSMDEQKEQIQEAINNELKPGLAAVEQLLDENEEVVDKIAEIGAKIFTKVFDKFGDAMTHDMIDKMAAKQAVYFGCLWTHLTEDCGFTEDEATAIVAGGRR